MYLIFKKIVSICLLILSVSLNAQVDITLDQQFNGQYDFLSIGGSMNSDDNTIFINGISTFVTIDNSSAFLNLPADATVVKAYLYWAESYSNNNQTITLNGNQFTADEVYYEDLSQIPQFFFYGYRKDLTNYVINNPSGLYEVTNIDLSAFFQELFPGIPESQYGRYDSAIVGWSLVVIYEQDILDYSQINLYDGFIYKGGIQNPSDLSISLTNLDVVDSQNSKVELLSYLGSINASNPTTRLYFNNVELNAPSLNPAGSIINSTNTYTNNDEFWNMDLDLFDISNFINIGDNDLDIFLELTIGTNSSLLQRVVTKVRSELPNTSAYFDVITGQNDCDERSLIIDWILSNENASKDLNEQVPVSFYYQIEGAGEVLLTTVTIDQNIPIDQVANFTETITIPDVAGLEFDLIIRSNDPGDGTFVIDETNNLDNTDIIEISLLESPQPLAVSDLMQCSNLLESFFNLESAITEPLNPEDSVNFFLSQTDAENNLNAIPDQLNYNPQNLIETIFLRRFDGNCFAISQFEIESLIPPQINTPITYALCDFSDAQTGFADFDLDTKINEITGGNTDYIVNFFTSQEDAEDLTIISGIASPFTIENTFNQTIYVRVEDATNNCLSFTQFDLEVNLLPVLAESSSIPSLESCDNQQNGTASFDLTANNNFILNGLNPIEHTLDFYTSLDDAENGNNTILDPENHSTNASEVFIRVTELATACYSITSYNLIINEIPTLQAVSTNFVCDLNDDGFAQFFLPLAEESIMINTNGFSFQYFETLNDAQNNTNPIIDINNYQNIQSPAQTIYIVATNDVTSCQNIQSFNIEVVPVEFIPFSLTDLEKCVPSLDGINIDMNLTEQEPFIFGSSDSSNYNVSYHFTQSEAASGQNPIPNPDTFLNIANPQEIWVRLVNTVSNCVEIGSFDYEILLAPVISSPENIQPIEQCANSENSSIQNWDLTTTITSFYNTPDLADITFHLSQSEAENNINTLPNNFQNNQNPQTIFVRVEALESGCVEYTNFDLVVNTIEDSLLPSSIERCDVNNDGFVEDFDFQPIIDDYAINFPEISLSFHTSISDASTQSNPLDSPYQNNIENEQTVFIYGFDNSTNCEQIFELLLRAVPIPELNSPAELRVCDSDQDDNAQFDLTLVEIEVLSNIIDTDNLLISYHTSLIDAETDLNSISNPTTFENTSLPQTIWVRVTDNSNLNNCFAITEFDLGIDFLPVASKPENLFLCDLENDNVESFDLSQQDESILNGLPENENSISYHKTVADAENNLNPIEGLYDNENNPQTIYVRLENNNANQCFTTTSFEIEVLETPIIDIEDEVILCQDETLVISINDNYDEYLWSNGETSPTITITEPGNYEVTALINHAELSCESTKIFEVLPSDQATITDVTTVDWSQNNNSITILVEGSGAYEYSIDGVNYQNSNVFNNLTEYEYLVHIRDKNGCGETLRRVYLLDYPQFFTPNGDGINDRWQIINSVQEIFTKIYIFDRYGKLVSDLNPAGRGWDGTFNGKIMPSNDYWFRVEREDGRVFTGHFTLKR